MTQLLLTELRKIIPYRTFWIILFFYAALLLLFVYASSNITLNGQNAGAQIYHFPGIWFKLTYIASYFNLLLGILLIILITDEYAFRTFRQQVIDGIFRHDLVIGKLAVVLLLSLIATLLIAVVGLGFGLYHSPDVSLNKIFSGSQHLLYYLVQSIGYMSIAVFFGFLIRKNGLAIIAFLLYTKILEPLLHLQFEDSLGKYFPMKVLGSLTPMPGQKILDSLTGPSLVLSPQAAVIPAIIFSALFFLMAYGLLKLRDL
jgi:ABC-2 type transport system permease protein